MKLYHVTVTVTNSGEGTNELTDLTITKPALGTYEIRNITNRISQGARLEKLTDLTYKLHNLKSGATAQVEFDVIPISTGTFQFGAHINPNTVLDMQSNNNQATITLSVNTPVNLDEITHECPEVELFDVETGRKLVQVTDDKFFDSHTAHPIQHVSNIYIDKTSWRGVKVRVNDSNLVMTAFDKFYTQHIYSGVIY